MRARRLFGRMWQAARDWPARIHPRPILILGNQKSGTTAIAALLAEMTGCTVTLDLAREMQEPAFHLVRRGQMTLARWIRRNRRDFASQIIKEPNFVVLHDLLEARFPQSPVVLVIRDPRDNLRSILNRLSIPGNLTRLDRPYSGLHDDAWNLYLQGSWLGIGDAGYIEVLAARWNLAADVYLNHVDRVIPVHYEVFLRDKQGQIERLAEQLHLPGRRDISTRLDQPFQPPGDRNVSWIDFFGPDNLRKIEQLCGPRMARLGYKTAETLPPHQAAADR
jgi:hypothetical protein